MNKSRGDLMLYRAASASLDRTIEALGRAKFERELSALKEGLALAIKNCRDRVQGLCTEGGEHVKFENTTCYIWSEGCDHDCVNELDI